MNVMEELLGLPTERLEEIPASTPKTDPLESEDNGQFLLDFSETIWQNMSEEHRKKSLACSEYIARTMELERLRLRAKVLGVEIPPEPIPVSEAIWRRPRRRFDAAWTSWTACSTRRMRKKEAADARRPDHLRRIDGAGKSLQVKRLSAHLEEIGVPHIVTKQLAERLGRRIRKVLLKPREETVIS